SAGFRYLSTAAALLCWACLSGGFARAEALPQAYTCSEYLSDLSSMNRLDGGRFVRPLLAGFYAWGLIPWSKLHPDDPNAAKQRIIAESLNACRGAPDAPAIQILTESVARAIGSDARNKRPQETGPAR